MTCPLRGILAVEEGKASDPGAFLVHARSVVNPQSPDSHLVVSEDLQQRQLMI